MQSARASDMPSGSKAGGSKRPRDDTDADDGASKRPKPEPGCSASPHTHTHDNNDDTFWYHDGNVIILVPGELEEWTLFKLHRSRLSRQCGYFKNLFESQATERFQKFPVYNAPHGLTTKAFKDLLMAIETPLDDLESPPSQSHTVSLLGAAHLLSCPAVLRLAKRRLRELWDSRHVPATKPRGPGDVRSASYYTAAISTIRLRLARAHSIPGVLKRAFYELLSSEEFWAAYRADRAALGLAHEDGARERLAYARAVLGEGELWAEFVLAVPDTDVDASAGVTVVRRLAGEWCCYNHSERGPSWRSAIVEKGDLRRGAMDPLRFNVVDKRRAYLKDEGWCEGCLGNKEKAWQEKRVEWWGMLDELFNL